MNGYKALQQKITGALADAGVRWPWKVGEAMMCNGLPLDERARLLDASTTPVLLPTTTLNPRERRAIEALMRAYVGQYALTEEDRDDLPEWVEAQS